MIKRLVALAAVALLLAAGGSAVVLAAPTSKQTVSVPPGTTVDPGRATASARCKGAQRFATTGGFTTSSPEGASPISVISEGVAGRGAWAARGVNPGDSEDSTLTSIAYCAKRAPDRIVAAKSKPIAVGERGVARATCPRGTRVIGGGYDTDVDFEGSKGVLVDRFALAGARTLEARGVGSAATAPPGTNAGRVTARATCAKGAPLTTREDSAVLDNDGVPATATATCRGRELAVFGGFFLDAGGAAPATVLTRSSKAGRDGWAASARAFNSGVEMTSYAYCR